MSALDLLVHGGTVVTEEGVFPANLGVREGKIVAVLAPDERPSATEMIDSRGLHVLPGVVEGRRGHGRLLRRRLIARQSP